MTSGALDRILVAAAVIPVPRAGCSVRADTGLDRVSSAILQASMIAAACRESRSVSGRRGDRSVIHSATVPVRSPQPPSLSDWSRRPRLARTVTKTRPDGTLLAQFRPATRRSWLEGEGNWAE